VTLTDTSGIDHSVEVSAESLYEAAALGIVEFRKSGLAEPIIGPATELRVLSYPAPPRQYSLNVRSLENWARFSVCVGPRQKVHRDRIAELLGLKNESS
jgi:hypothetical protein